MPDETNITIKYTGKDDFQETVHGNPTFQSVKLKAMHKFDIEPSAASQYVLQFGDVDLPDNEHVLSLHQPTLVLVLTLKHEPPKG